MSAVGRWLREMLRPARRSGPTGADGPSAHRHDADGASAHRPATERLGAWGEEVAAKHLEAKGYRIVERRSREGRGELDLIAVGTDRAGAFVVFVEVKTRSREAFGGPEAALDRRKRNALRRSAMHYLRRLPGAMPRFRFDLVAVVGSPDSPTPPVVRHETDVLRLDPRVQISWTRRVR